MVHTAFGLPQHFIKKAFLSWRVMTRTKKISFLARIKVKRKISFRAGKKKVSFTARVPSKKRRRITFRARKARK